MPVLKYISALREGLQRYVTEQIESIPRRFTIIFKNKQCYSFNDDGELRSWPSSLQREEATTIVFEEIGPAARDDAIHETIASRDREYSVIANLQAYLDDAGIWEDALREPHSIPDDLSVCCGTIYSYGELDDPSDRWDSAREYHFQNCVYRVLGNYTVDQDKLLIQEEFDAERRKFERLKAKFSVDSSVNMRNKRQPIPEHVRIAVWRRDGGACAQCGSREKLEYDHMIPLSLGGSDTVRNIELLCEACNRSKSNQIQ
jgi:hypothetical protein